MVTCTHFHSLKTHTSLHTYTCMCFECIHTLTHKPSHTNPHTLTHKPSHPHTQVHDAKVLEVPNDRTETYLQAIRSEISPKLQLVVTIFPTSRDDRYSAVKKLCCIDSPVPSQVSDEGGEEGEGGGVH